MKTRKMSLTWKVCIRISAMCIFCFTLLGFLFYNRVSDTLIKQSKEYVLGIANIAAHEIDGDTFSSITSAEDEAFEQVYNSLTKYREATNVTYIYSMKMMDGQCFFAVDTDPEEPADFEEEYELQEAMELAFGGTAACDKEVTTDEWGTYFSTFAPIKNSAGAVVGIVGCDISIDDINAQLSSLRTLITVLISVVFVVCFLLILFVSGSITKNLKKLYNKVHDLTVGECDLTKQVHISTGDELEAIANEFNTFIGQIRDLFTDISKVSAHVEDNCIHVDQAVNTFHKELSSIFESIESLSAGMQETSANTSLINESIATVTSQINDLNHTALDNSNKALTISQNAFSTMEETKQVAERTTAIIAKLQEEFAYAEKQCQKINEIDDVTKKILAVSSKTQMLSLNANIEAAKAGEAGKGFAVVANNINELSGQINILVTEIQAVNEEIKDAIQYLLSKVTDVSAYLDADVTRDYQNYVQTSHDYSVHMNEMSKILKEFHFSTAVVNERISSIHLSIQEIDNAVTNATSDVMVVQNGSVELKTNMDVLNNTSRSTKDASTNLTEQINKYNF